MMKSMTATVLLCAMAQVAMAQEAPSWRSEADRPSRPELPPQVEKAQIDFEIDRGALFGQSMGFAPTQPVPQRCWAEK